MNAIESIAFLVTWALVGVNFIPSSKCLDPEGPGPPQLYHSTPPQDSDEQLDLNLSGYSHEMNHINAPRKYNNNNKNSKSNVVASSKIVNENVIKVKTNKNSKSNSCANDGSKAQKYVHDGETVLAANNEGDSKESSSPLLLDVISDVFDTSNEPLIPGIIYKGNTFSLKLLLS